MKSRWAILTILVVLAAGLLFAGQSYPAAQAQSAVGEHPDASSPEAHLQMLTEKLNLTADQKAKVKPILEDQAQQMKAVRDDTSLSQDQQKSKMKAIHGSCRDQINGVLTPEQQAKFRQLERDERDHQ